MARTQEETEDQDHIVDKKEKKRKKKKHKKKKRRQEGAVSSKKRRRQEVSSDDSGEDKKPKKSKKKLGHPDEKKDDAVESKKSEKSTPTAAEEDDIKAGIPTVEGDDWMVQTSALDYTERTDDDPHNVALLLCHQYVEPLWDAQTYHQVLQDMQALGDSLWLTGRMRVAREGLNCTLTGSHDGILGYCKALRERSEFKETEFKLITDLPQHKSFPTSALWLGKGKGTILGLLQPQQYHEKLAQDDTVVIDVRNHYEAAIGRRVLGRPLYIDYQPPDGKDAWPPPSSKVSR